MAYSLIHRSTVISVLGLTRGRSVGILLYQSMLLLHLRKLLALGALGQMLSTIL